MPTGKDYSDQDVKDVLNQIGQNFLEQYKKGADELVAVIKLRQKITK